MTLPDDMHPAERNAVEILADVKAKAGAFRELRDMRLTCECTPSRRVIARVFVGNDDDGVLRTWLWVPSVKPAGDRPSSPAMAVGVPQEAGGPSNPVTATCPRCNEGYLLIPGGAGPGTIQVFNLGPPTYGTVVP